jgi:eukaryotic-like serine/threonine-protein kinase
MTIDKIGKFQVLGTLGNGAHSAILHIRRQADSREYALKVVPIADAEEHKFLDQARHEFEIARMLDHPCLIKIYALETHRDWLFRVRKVHLLIEYVDGKTLDTIARLSMARLVQVFARVAAGMSHMHRRGVCHADLKPNNILLSRSGAVKIIDYGLGWIKGENKGRVQGTLEYMAPEQARRKIVNERTDIYNLGATMYRLVTGRHPPKVAEGLLLEGRSWDQAVKPVRECSPEAPAELCDLIQRCLRFNPERRPERMSKVQDALQELTRTLVRRPEDHLEAAE